MRIGTTERLAWAAGFVDGEGSVGILGTKRKMGPTTYCLQLVAAQTTVEPLDAREIVEARTSRRGVREERQPVEPWVDPQLALEAV